MQKRFRVFTNLITSIGRSIYRMKAEAMAEYDLKSSHLGCIYYLGVGAARTAAQLARLADEDKANISRALGELEKQGLITRERSEKGRLKRTVALTAEGREVADFLSEHVENILTIVGEGITDEEREIMYRTLGKIDEKLRALCED